MLDFMKVLATSLGTTARVVLAKLAGRGATGDDNNAEAVDGAETIFPMGFASRPKLSEATEAVVFRIGKEVLILAKLDKSMAKFATTDLDEGEVLLYGPAEPDSQIAIRKAGNIEVKAKDGQNITVDVIGSGDVVVNGGSLKVARDTDPVEVTIPIGTVVVAATGATLNPTPITLSGTIKNGALHLKA